MNEARSCSSHIFKLINSKFEYSHEVETGGIEQIISVRDGDMVFLVTRNDISCRLSGSYVWNFYNGNFTVTSFIFYFFILVMVLFQLLSKLDDLLLLQESLIPSTFYSLERSSVTEYKVVSGVESTVRVIRRWPVREGKINVKFQFLLFICNI